MHCRFNGKQFVLYMYNCFKGCTTVIIQRYGKNKKGREKMGKDRKIFKYFCRGEGIMATVDITVYLTTNSNNFFMELFN